MNEQITPDPEQIPVEDTVQPAPIVEPLSITDKFVGIFSEPSATYQNVRDAGARTSDWLVPLLVFVVILIAGTILRFSNPEFLEQIRQQQIDAIEQRVENGQMSQSQAEQAMEQLETFAGFQKIIAPIGAAVGVVIVFFLIVLVYWFLSRMVFKGSATFALILSVVGLSFYIGVIDQLISILLMYVTGKPLATFSPTLLMASDSQSFQQMSYRLLSNLNPISIWSYCVVSIGIHKVAVISKGKAFGLVFGLWIIWILLSTFVFSMIPGMG